MPPKGRRPRAAARPVLPFPWDNGSTRNVAQIERNYVSIRQSVVDAALDGRRPTVAAVRDWHRESVARVALAEPWVAGRFRGEGPTGCTLRVYQNVVRSGGIEYPTELVRRVRNRVAATFTSLDARLDDLDARRASGAAVSDLYPDLIETCAWVHGEWIRIHPFADHNGSTARLLALNVGLLHGVVLNLPGKPRSAIPGPGLLPQYEAAAASQMLGSDYAMVAVLHNLVAVP